MYSAPLELQACCAMQQYSSAGSSVRVTCMQERMSDGTRAALCAS